MAKNDEPYQRIIVESYRPSSTAGKHGLVHMRPVAGQGFDPGLQVECSRALVNPQIHPVGTKFKIRVKLTDREGSGEYLYSHFSWPYEVVE